MQSPGTRGGTTSTQQQEQHEHVERSVDALYVVRYHVQGHRTIVLGVCATRRNTPPSHVDPDP